MSVASRNPFALLEDNEASRPSSPTPAPAKAAAPAPTQPRTNQRSRGPASRGGRYYARGGKPSAPNDAEGDVADDTAGDGPRKRFDGEGRGRGRGRGRGDRGRGGRGGRTFDRHSATGKTDSDKKVHQGWGGDEGNSELKAEDAGATDAAAEASGAPPEESGWGAAATDAWGTAEVPAGDAAPAAPAEGDKPAEGRRGRDREPEEEDNTLTLDQYLKQQKEKELDIIPKLETRKANEGDDSIWKGATVVTKKDEDEDAYFIGKSKASAPKQRSKKEEKVYLEIEARFERPQRGGRGRGGSGDRGRGSRGRGGRGGRANGSGPQTLDVDDQAAFPSLA